jgi:hypothetical protein
MATVRFSDSLCEDIRNNAKAMFKKAFDEAKADVPAHWADKMYQSFFPSDIIAKFNALPSYAMKEELMVGFTGFSNAPEDVFQTAEFSRKAYECDEIQLHFSKPMRWPNQFQAEVTGFKSDWRSGKADFRDSRWDWLKPEFKEYVRKIFEVEAKQAKFLEGVNTLMKTYSTLAPALKAFPALWDLVPNEAKERHKKIVERKKAEVDVDSMDIKGMTAAVTFSKLTR